MSVSSNNDYSTKHTFQVVAASHEDNILTLSSLSIGSSIRNNRKKSIRFSTSTCNNSVIKNVMQINKERSRQQKAKVTPIAKENKDTDSLSSFSIASKSTRSKRKNAYEELSQDDNIVYNLKESKLNNENNVHINKHDSNGTHKSNLLVCNTDFDSLSLEKEFQQNIYNLKRDESKSSIDAKPNDNCDNNIRNFHSRFYAHSQSKTSELSTSFEPLDIDENGDRNSLQQNQTFLSKFTNSFSSNSLYDDSSTITSIKNSFRSNKLVTFQRYVKFLIMHI